MYLMILCLKSMATAKRKITTKSALRVSSSKKTELKVSVPKKTNPKRKLAEETMPEMSFDNEVPKSGIFTKKYLYAVLIVLAIIGVLFTVSRFWIIAWVDNKPITKFELYSLLEKRDEGKTTEELIVERLLLSEGQKQRQSVSDAEVEAEVKKIEEQQGGADQLNQILSAQKLSRADFLKLVELQLLKQKLFGGGVNISEDDVKKYIDENKASLPANILDNPQSSEAAQLRDSVKEQLKQLKINDNFNNWLNQNLTGPRVIKS